MRNYHDENYDGVVLKIPSWFIKMNELEDAFKAFQTALESANRSMFYPDHQRNLFELKNADIKIKEVKAVRDAENKKQLLREQRFEKITKGEIYELEWIKCQSAFDEGFELDGQSFDDSEMFTKRGVKAEFEKLVREKVYDWKSFVNLYKCNQMSVRLRIDMEGADESFFDINNYSLYQAGYGALGISYKRLNVKCEWRKGRTDGWRYRLYNLIKLNDGCLAINNQMNVNHALRLDGFERNGLELIKKQK